MKKTKERNFLKKLNDLLMNYTVYALLLMLILLALLFIAKMFFVDNKTSNLMNDLDTIKIFLIDGCTMLGFYAILLDNKDKHFGKRQQTVINEIPVVQSTKKMKDKTDTEGKLDIDVYLEESLLKMFSDAMILGAERNQLHRDLIVFKREYSSYLNVCLFGHCYKSINLLPRIMAEVKYDYETKSNYIFIDHIQTTDKEIGNGSIVMKYFINEAAKTGATYISGSLSYVDQEHFDRLEHFYKKFGFEVKFNPTRTSGTIKKIL
ncbi:hypothetical protein ACQKND_16285 [Viridibacillus arvi]|uniref:hypothetical protein n=1 Tax=Viridibacillus arvi TaxID=263475 RepID=UPI003D03B60E